MQVKVLGTAAAEGWPAVFCGCEACRKAGALGGKNIRSRTSLQIGPRHKIDLPPDVWYHSTVHGLNSADLKHLFVTHSHHDHFAVEQLEYLEAPFAHCRCGPLKIYGSDSVLSVIRSSAGNSVTKSAAPIELEPFAPVDADGLTFVPVIAAHRPGELCFNYVVSCEGQSILYACDTGWYPDETWAFLEKLELDCVIAECTEGPGPGGVYHLDFEHLYRMRKRLKDAGAFAEGPFLATHFSHNINMSHEELEQALAGHGIQAAYDGMEIAV